MNEENNKVIIISYSSFICDPGSWCRWIASERAQPRYWHIVVVSLSVYLQPWQLLSVGNVFSYLKTILAAVTHIGWWISECITHFDVIGEKFCCFFAVKSEITQLFRLLILYDLDFRGLILFNLQWNQSSVYKFVELIFSLNYVLV